MTPSTPFMIAGQHDSNLRMYIVVHEILRRKEVCMLCRQVLDYVESGA